MSGNHEEVEYIEIETPPCWGYMDWKDQSCQRCGINEYCEDEQEATRPGCYGLFQDERNEECARCLDESQCVEYQLLLKQGDETMATRKVALRKKPRPKRRRPPAEQEEVLEEKAVVAPKPARRRKAKPVAKPAPKPESAVEESDGDYDQWEMRELREELKDRELATRGNKAKLIMRLLADDNEEEDAEPGPAPKAKPARRGRKAKAVPEPEEVADEDGPGLFVESDMATFIDSVGVGQSVVATRIDDDTWSFAIVSGGVAVAAKPAGMGLKGKAYWEEVASQEYWDFDNVDAGNGKSWHDMTVAEREEMAAEYGVEIDEDLNPKVRAMRLKPALLKELGIYKYKPEYRTRSERNVVK